jgi:hemerythrin
VLRKMVTEDPARSGISRAAYDAVTRAFLEPATLKKVDVGGGLIHGQAEDFASDTSGAIFLSHTSAPPSEDQQKYGSCAAFGRQDRLAAASTDYLRRGAGAYLAECFPAAPAKERAVLEASPAQEYAPGEVILDAAALVDSVLLLLAGEVDVTDPRTGLQCRQGAGALVGELSCGRGIPARCTCRARGHVTALRIPCGTFTDFLRRTGMFDELGSVYDQRVILGASRLFGEMMSLPLQVRIARAMEKRVVREDAEIRFEGRAEILLLADGLVSVFLGSRPIENLRPGDFCGEETLMRGARELPAGWWQRMPRRGHHLFSARALLDSTLYAIPAGTVEDIPVVQWKLMETYERRLKSIRSEIRFEWLDSYELGNGAVDEQHRSLFTSIDTIASIAEGRAPSDKMGNAVEGLLAIARSHLGYEESLAARRPPFGWDQAVRGHEEFLRKVNGQSRQMESIPVAAMSTFVEYLKDWMMDHTLLESRRFAAALTP